MKLYLLKVAATIPLASALAIQDVLSEIKNLENEVFNTKTQNPLEKAIESSPTFTPAEVPNIGIKNKNKHTLPNINDINNWIQNFINQPFDEITNGPSDVFDENLDEETTVEVDFQDPHNSDKTIYQLISESKYTTIIAKIINEDQELIDYLNSTKRKFTFFAPTDDAIRKIPCHHRHHDNDGDGGHDHHIPKEVVRTLLHYHSSPYVLSTIQLFHRHTIPSALEDPFLGTTKPDEDDDEEGLPQRLTVRSGFKGLTLNFYSHIVAADISASNGLIHGVDSILIPPPPTLLLLDILPTKFSTFNLALYKSSLNSYLNTSSSPSPKSHGFTLFTPTNSAFQHLGLKINAFLFSPFGRKYLTALLKYHIVPNETLYSDVLYTKDGEIKPFGIKAQIRDNDEEGTKGFTHIDLETLLPGHTIAVDIEHLGPYVSFKLNGWQRVAFADALAKDGVIHVLDHVLIPPRRLDGVMSGEGEEVEMGVEELMERLQPWVEDEDNEDEVLDGFFDEEEGAEDL
ncbi:Fasciclin domain-containing protein [Aspergillus californicus]